MNHKNSIKVFSYIIWTINETLNYSYRLDTAFFDGIAIPVKGIIRQAHYLACLRHVPKFPGQIEKIDFMTDDFLVTLQHEGYLLKALMVTDCTTIKTGNSLLFQ